MSTTNSRTATPATPVSRRWHLLAMVVLHAFGLLGVIVVPPIVYKIISASSLLRGVPGMLYVGGVTYPLYTVYWIVKLKSFRARFVLIHLTILLTIAIATAFTAGRSTPLAVASLPTVVAALPVLGIVVAWWRRIRSLAMTCLISALVALPIGLAGSFFTALGSGLASVTIPS